MKILCITLTLHVAFARTESFVVAVIFVRPTRLPVIFPPLFTEATLLLADFQLSFGLEELFVHTVVLSLWVWPTPILIFLLSNLTLLLSLATFTLHLALWLYFVIVHEITHEPILYLLPCLMHLLML